MEIPLFKSPATPRTTKQTGDAAEALALQYLQRAGMQLVARNYRSPGRGGGEIDLIMRASDGTCVFVEVRLRKSAGYGGAAASVSATKQRRLIFAARHFLLRYASPPPCRFDVVAVQAGDVQWMPGAFDGHAW